MSKRGFTWLAAVVGLLAAGCMASVGSEIKVPEDAAQNCAEQCAKIGLKLSAVAIMANTVGCVCQRDATVASASEYTAATSAGMATILMQRRAQQEQQQAQQRQMQSSTLQ